MSPNQNARVQDVLYRIGQDRRVVDAGQYQQVEQVDVFECHVGFLEYFASRWNGAFEHECWINANLSGGGLFRTPSSAKDAKTQAQWEPLTEIHQIKGNSECRWGVGTEDELCQFELVSSENFFTAAAGPGRDSAPMPAKDQGFPLNAKTKTYHSFIREVLKGGLVLGQEARQLTVWIQHEAALI